MRVFLGVADAVRQCGDNWTLAPHLSRYVAREVLLRYRVSSREHLACDRDGDLMRMCELHGRLFQVGG